MSKPALTVVETKPALSAEAVAAMDAGRDALAERERLLGLQRKLTGDLAEARRKATELQQAHAQADVDLILAGDEPPAEMGAAVEQASLNAKRAADNVLRQEHALAALPRMLLDADAAIEAAAGPLNQQRQATFEAAREAYELQLRGAVDQLVAVLRLGHALNRANNHGLRPHLDGITIPDPFSGKQPILREGTRYTAADGSMVELSTTWRDDAAAAALHDLYAPLQTTLDRLRPEVERITHDRETARLSRQAYGNDAPPPAPGPSAPRPTYEAPKGAGPGQTRTSETRVGLPARFSASGGA